jgi:hypothetical protein
MLTRKALQLCVKTEEHIQYVVCSLRDGRLNYLLTPDVAQAAEERLHR